MNKKIILSLTATALMASSLLAYNGQGQMQEGKVGYKQSCKQKTMKKSRHTKGAPELMQMFMKLDLSDKQKTEIIEIVKKSMESMPNPNKAFSDKSFDKKEFIKLEKEKRDNKIERKADMLEKIYATLDASQKKDLKTMLDMRDLMKKKMMKKGMNCNDKNCNGRR
nr:Spy/CpxP family protein refolding chaperone [uncultured Sulfurimonas sp.]